MEEIRKWSVAGEMLHLRHCNKQSWIEFRITVSSGPKFALALPQ